MYEDINLKGDNKTVLFEICQKIKVCYILVDISMHLSYRLGLGLPQTIREICTRNRTVERRESAIPANFFFERYKCLATSFY